MHIHFRQTVTVTPPALQEHMPLMPKTKDASQLVLITRLTNFTLILTDVLQLVPLDFGLILLPFHAWQIAPLPLILSKITQPALESACQCALLPTSLGKLSTTHVWNLVQTELTVKFTMRQILLWYNGVSLSVTHLVGDCLLTTESVLTSALKDTGENSRTVRAQVSRQTAVVCMLIMRQERVLLLFSVLMDFTQITHPGSVLLTVPQAHLLIQTQRYVICGVTLHTLETQERKCVWQFVTPLACMPTLIQTEPAWQHAIQALATTHGPTTPPGLAWTTATTQSPTISQTTQPSNACINAHKIVMPIGPQPPPNVFLLVPPPTTLTTALVRVFVSRLVPLTPESSVMLLAVIMSVWMSAGLLITLVIRLEIDFVPRLAQGFTMLRMTPKDCVYSDVKLVLMDQQMYV